MAALELEESKRIGAAAREMGAAPTPPVAQTPGASISPPASTPVAAPAPLSVPLTSKPAFPPKSLLGTGPATPREIFGGTPTPALLTPPAAAPIATPALAAPKPADPNSPPKSWLGTGPATPAQQFGGTPTGPVPAAAPAPTVAAPTAQPPAPAAAPAAPPAQSQANIDAIGAKLDAARAAMAAASKAPRIVQGKVNPEAVAALEQHKSTVAALEAEFANALGPAPGVGVGALIPGTSNIRPEVAIPALASAPGAPAAVAGPPAAAPAPVAATPGAPAAAPGTAVARPPAPAPTAAPAATTALPPSLMESIRPMPGATMTPPQLLQAPVQQKLPPLPVFGRDAPGHSGTIWDAMTTLGKDMGAYQNARIGNRQAQTDFENQIKTGNFNMDQFVKAGKVQTEFDDNTRKNLDQAIKLRAAEAVRELASGKYDKDPAARKRLRILAGLDKGGAAEGTPQIIFGPVDPETGRQTQMAVWVSKETDPETGRPTTIPLQIPGFQTPNQGKTLPAGMVRQVGTDSKTGKPVYEDAKGARHGG